MIVNVDASQLEWLCAVYWSQDPVGIDELLKEYDIHEDNQKRFKLPSRLVAKTLIFRIIYGGSGYSFTIDPEFSHLGSEEWWDEKITAIYAKYKGLRAWHERLHERVVRDDGKLCLPTGREYQFAPAKYGSEGIQKYPRTKILNYPVQGLAADLMAIARVSCYKRLKDIGGILWVNTVHDSIVLDMPDPVWQEKNKIIISRIQEAFKDIPSNFNRLFGIEFNLPVRCEITYGRNWGELREIS